MFSNSQIMLKIWTQNYEFGSNFVVKSVNLCTKIS
jgi:hypothetical protein